MNQAPPPPNGETLRILREDHDATIRHTNSLIVLLLCIQSVGALIFALVLTPRTWIGQTSAPHIHLLAAAMLGPLLTALPVYLWRVCPTAPLTRHVMAGAQVMFSALLIHLTGGRIETHFHVFGSLAILAFYRDPWVIVSASAVVAIDHVVRGVFVPQSVFGVLSASEWRWLEHAAWVVFEDIFLIMSIRQVRQAALDRAKLICELDERRRESRDDALLARTSVDKSADAVFWIDESAHIIDANESACRQLGYDREECLKLTMSDVRVGFSKAAWKSTWDDLLTQVSMTDEAVHKTRDGKEIPVSASISLIHHRGQLLSCVFARDITERKVHERRLRDSLNVSEKLNDDLRAQTALAQQLATEAQAAVRAKSDFLANMSHELRTPMTAILGFTEIMTDPDQDDEEREECIQTIKRNGDHLLNLIDDILDLSKIEAGSMTIERTSCSPSAIVADVESMMRINAEAKGLVFVVEPSSPLPPTIMSDPTRIRQILINLIGNAIKFTDKGSVRLVTGMIERDGGRFLQFDVVDTGKGITPSQSDKLFQPFVQADASTTRQHGGTGLGLTISRRFAKMLGGDLSVIATAPNAGSTFRAIIGADAPDHGHAAHPHGGEHASAAPWPP
ncbi:MAG: PAS domain-containing sensor histidine kinase [Planctomycetota bacterium]|jgi:PAS domain S-box-containing protein